MSPQLQPPISFGILTIPYQILDAAGPLDILSSCSTTLLGPLEALSSPNPQGLTSNAIPITFHHISETLSAVPLTANLRVLPTTTCDACPPLDHLLIPGPDISTFTLSPRFARFITDHVEAGGGIFTTCTGAYVLSLTGLLDGKEATVNHACLGLARRMRPQVRWVERQWVVADEGRVWTAAGASAGMDMMAHWVGERYGAAVLGVGLAMLDFEPRDVEGKRVLKAEEKGKL